MSTKPMLSRSILEQLLLKLQTKLKKTRKGELLVLNVPYRSIAYHTLQKHACTQMTKLMLMPVYGPGMISEQAYGPIYDAIERTVMQNGAHIPRGGVLLACGEVFQLIERIQRLSDMAMIPPNTPLVQLVLHFDNCLLHVMLHKKRTLAWKFIQQPFFSYLYLNQHTCA